MSHSSSVACILERIQRCGFPPVSPTARLQHVTEPAHRPPLVAFDPAQMSLQTVKLAASAIEGEDMKPHRVVVEAL